ncbi:MAG: TrmH family RNA methyltransferase [Chloroflexota bacterium]
MKTVPRLPLTVILDNVRSAYNVGSVLRTADCAWIERVVTCGITPHAQHPKVKKTALGSEDIMHTAHYPTLADGIRALRDEGKIAIYAKEITDRSQSLWAQPPDVFTGRAALIFGSETEGVQLNVTQSFDIPEVHLPQFGVKQSLNVASAAAIAVYHWRYMATQAGALE